MAAQATRQQAVWAMGVDTGKARAVGKLVTLLRRLGDMDKRTMSGRCHPQTTRMENFMKQSFGFHNVEGYFVDGVRKFELETHLKDMSDDTVLTFSDAGVGERCTVSFRMTVKEVKAWQSSFKIYYADDVFVGDEGKEQIRKVVSGKSESGLEAFRVKFAARISQNPVFCAFDGKVVSREPGEPTAGRIYMVSVSGVDFAGRKHDVMDVTTYLENWQEVYACKDGAPIVWGGRDFMPKGVRGAVRVKLLKAHLKKMVRIRMRALNDMKVQVVGETGIGLGVFSGDGIGIGAVTRTISARALKEVLEEEEYPEIKLVVISLPVFRPKDNYFYFKAAFKQYKGQTPVLILDQDMHMVALTAAKAGFTTSELNPADSHGVVGEYWQNRGPGTEEKLALTTAALLTQHHAVNPAVLNPDNYIPLSDTSEVVSEEESKATSAKPSTMSPIADALTDIAKSAEDGEVTHLFTYGTLRDDDDSGAHWTALFVAGCSAQSAVANGFQLLQSPRHKYPHAVRDEDAEVVGRLLSWPSKAEFARKMLYADRIEGRAYTREVVVAQTLEGTSVLAYMYHMPKAMPDAVPIQAGDWLKRERRE